MDKQLIEWLAREAGFLVDRGGRAFANVTHSAASEALCDDELRRYRGRWG